MRRATVSRTGTRATTAPTSYVQTRNYSGRNTKTKVTRTSLVVRAPADFFGFTTKAVTLQATVRNRTYK